jgi:hypothetical protein
VRSYYLIEEYDFLGFNAVKLACRLILLVSYLAYTSTVKMEAIVPFGLFTRRLTPEDRGLHSHRSDNRRSDVLPSYLFG